MQGRRPFPTPARWLLRYRQAPSLVALALTGALFSLHANAYRVEVDAPAPLRKFLEQFLDLARYKDRTDLNDDQFNFMLGDAPQQVKDLAATEGYFSPQTKVEVERSGAEPVVRITVEPGPRTLISTVISTFPVPPLMSRRSRSPNYAASGVFRPASRSASKTGAKQRRTGCAFCKIATTLRRALPTRVRRSIPQRIKPSSTSNTKAGHATRWGAST